MSKNTLPRLTLLALALLASRAPAQEAEQPTPDPFLWLEEVQGKEALAWVEKQNAVSKAEFASTPMFREIYDETLALLNAKDRLIRGTQHGKWIYSVWRDATNPRGLYRRCSVESLISRVITDRGVSISGME